MVNDLSVVGGAAPADRYHHLVYDVGSWAELMTDFRHSIVLLLLSVVTGCCNDAEIPAETKRLYSPHARERNDGALALARCGGRARDAVPRLVQLLYDENVGVQSASAYALREIDTPPARRALERARAKDNN